jgi:hypothetical protein
MTCVLAFAAVAGTKASKFHHTSRKGYVPNPYNDGKCTIFIYSYYTSGSNPAVTEVGATPIVSYNSSISNCDNQLWTEPAD